MRLVGWLAALALAVGILTGGAGAGLTRHYVAAIAPPVEPRIGTVTFTGSPANPTVAVTGRELTPLPGRDHAGGPVGHNGCPSKPGDYGSDYGGFSNLEDITGRWSAGLNAGAITSCVGIILINGAPAEVHVKYGSPIRP
jgi:hypothetical protein